MFIKKYNNALIFCSCIKSFLIQVLWSSWNSNNQRARHNTHVKVSLNIMMDSVQYWTKPFIYSTFLLPLVFIPDCLFINGPPAKTNVALGGLRSVCTGHPSSGWALWHERSRAYALCNYRWIPTRWDDLQVEEELSGGGWPEVLATLSVWLHGLEKYFKHSEDDSR